MPHDGGGSEGHCSGGAEALAMSSSGTGVTQCLYPEFSAFVCLLLQAHLPFAVIGSTEELKIGNKMMKARQYPWGTVQGE